MEAEMASPTLSQVTPAEKVRVISLPKPETKTQAIESTLSTSCCRCRSAIAIGDSVILEYAHAGYSHFDCWEADGQGAIKWSESKLHLAPQPAVSLAPVIPFPQTISQLEIGLLVSLRNRLAQFEAQVKESEDSIKARLEAGAPLESGSHTAKLESHFRRHVAWE